MDDFRIFVELVTILLLFYARFLAREACDFLDQWIEPSHPCIGMENLTTESRAVPGLGFLTAFLCQEMEPEHSPASLHPSCPGLQKL